MIQSPLGASKEMTQHFVRRPDESTCGWRLTCRGGGGLRFQTFGQNALHGGVGRFTEADRTLTSGLEALIAIAFAQAQEATHGAQAIHGWVSQ